MHLRPVLLRPGRTDPCIIAVCSAATETPAKSAKSSNLQASGTRSLTVYTSMAENKLDHI